MDAIDTQDELNSIAYTLKKAILIGEVIEEDYHEGQTALINSIKNGSIKTTGIQIILENDTERTDTAVSMLMDYLLEMRDALEVLTNSFTNKDEMIA